MNEKIIEGKKRYSQKRAQRPLFDDENYDLENNESRNASSRRLKIT